MRRLRNIAGVVLAVFMIGTALLYFVQEKIIFLPTQLAVDYEFRFENPFEEVFLDASDGARLHALHFTNDRPKGLILYFHGNAGDLSRWGEITQYFVEQGFDVLISDYRTYGKSTGVLNEANLHQDAELFYTYALQRYNEADIIVFGRSLGAAIATPLAAKHQPRQLLLETPFYNLHDVAKTRFPFLPTKALLKYIFESDKAIGKVKCPIAIFHGTDDSVVAYDSGKRLFEAIEKVPKRFYTIDGGGHNDLIEFERYREGVEIELNRKD